MTFRALTPDSTKLLSTASIKAFFSNSFFPFSKCCRTISWKKCDFRKKLSKIRGALELRSPRVRIGWARDYVAEWEWAMDRGRWRAIEEEIESEKEGKTGEMREMSATERERVKDDTSSVDIDAHVSSITSRSWRRYDGRQAISASAQEHHIFKINAKISSRRIWITIFLQNCQRLARYERFVESNLRCILFPRNRDVFATVAALQARRVGTEPPEPGSIAGRQPANVMNHATPSGCCTDDCCRGPRRIVAHSDRQAHAHNYYINSLSEKWWTGETGAPSPFSNHWGSGDTGESCDTAPLEIYPRSERWMLLWQWLSTGRCTEINEMTGKLRIKVRTAVLAILRNLSRPGTWRWFAHCVMWF